MIYMDVSRTLSRLNRRVPTGIDRVELAYLRHALKNYPDQVKFVAISGTRPFSISHRRLRHALKLLSDRWAEGKEASVSFRHELIRKTPSTFFMQRSLNLRLRIEARRNKDKAVYFNASHHHLEKRDILKSLLSLLDCEMAVFLHDAIPALFPQYSNPGDGEKHQHRLENTAELARLVIVNSHATAEQLRSAMDREVPVYKDAVVNPLWLEPSLIERNLETLPRLPKELEGTAYFVSLGTIEPRKNHQLLLDAWRKLNADGAKELPKLAIIGQRGWGYDDIVAQYEAGSDLALHVVELGGLDDRTLISAVKQATAILLPSFSEGFGLPLLECLSMGKKVLASDIPAYREVGGEAATYLATTDITAWAEHIQALHNEQITLGRAPDATPPDLSAFDERRHMTQSFDAFKSFGWLTD